MTTTTRPPRQTAFIPISTGRRARSATWGILVVAAFVVALIPLAWLLIIVITRGFEAIVSPTWWTNSLKGVLPEQFAGGVYHAIYGTLVQAGIAALIAVPLGILIAIYLVEYGKKSPLARLATFMVDVLSGIPSIVAALFVFSLWIVTLGFQQSAFAVALALVLLMIPVVVRSTEEMLRIVPDDLREASYALGLSKAVTIMRVVLPTASSGIVSGILLAIARVMGETAPVLVLVGYSRAMNYDVFEGNMASLPLLIYTELINPLPAGQLRAWGAALTLIIIIAVINIAATAIARFLNRKQNA
ncbi:phosphate ABC transporter permease PstA [Herbiconiux sp.]|jgi:phosphate transport system permease protein|uniref:phosphate ABC transporter permease PstA n=1 Tax=Herbiconiux sp. TaxID=1871186 RepID=UPI0025C4A17E|nr:phosphate ABC transporter permease PstA [Herbiconiux sp.]